MDCFMTAGPGGSSLFSMLRSLLDRCQVRLNHTAIIASQHHSSFLNSDLRTPMTRTRDADATRSRILKAAASLFSEKGFDGATLSEVARRAKVSKQLLSYHFRDKESLFREVHDVKFRPAVEWHDAMEDHPTELIARRFMQRAQDPDYVRFLTWDAASRPRKPIPGQTDRYRRIRDYGKAIAQLQQEGRISSRHDPQLLHLATLCLATYPLAFPQITHLITGQAPTNPAFQKRWKIFLAAVGKALMEEDGVPHPTPDLKTSTRK